jgi:2-hydroxy-4-carboxymuconate semialdehyde hemiacetal dehydrogenase
MKICMVGQGAFANKHMDGIKNIDDVEVVSIVGGAAATTEAVAKEQGIPHWTTDLDEGINQPGVDLIPVINGYIKEFRQVI